VVNCVVERGQIDGVQEAVSLLHESVTFRMTRDSEVSTPPKNRPGVDQE
jgi:hypothetical protein